MNRYLKRALLILLCVLLSPFVLFFGTFAGIVVVGSLYADKRDEQIRCEIVEYVLENRDSIELEDADRRQTFLYQERGLLDSVVEFGYFYEPRPERLPDDEAYRNGYLAFGRPNTGTDWFYYEDICDNWFYYEYHYDY